MAFSRLLVLLASTVVHLLFFTTSVTEAFLVTTPSHNSQAPFHPFARQLKISSTNNDADEDDNIFFDDFGDAVIGGSSSEERGGIAQQLKERIQEYQQEAVRKDTQLAKNWQTGNWKVRGFSLDKTDALVGDDEEQETTPIHVSCIARDQTSPDRIAVARTDGSVCFVRLGTEYLAKFVSKLTASPADDNDTIKVSSQLVRQEEAEEIPGKEGEKDKVASQETPFEVVHQFSAHESALTALLMEDDMIFTAGENSSEIMVWSVPDDDDEKVSPLRKLSNAHNGTIVSLKTMSMNPTQDDPNLLLSAATDGSFAVWDIETGDLVFKCQMMDDGGNSEVSITCADVQDNTLFLGLSTGHVVGYIVNEVIESASVGETCPVPSCRFLAHESGGVSAIRCSGDGSLGRSRPGTKSSILLTGGANGEVKQWEILSRKADEQSITKLEHWPRLANQRMQKRAHMFTGHSDGPIAALQAIDPSKFLSAGSDGTVRAWSPTSGKELFRMDGFTEPVTSLCLDHDMLITNGMDAFVCVHDFDVSETEVEDGYELEW